MSPEIDWCRQTMSGSNKQETGNPVLSFDVPDRASRSKKVFRVTHLTCWCLGWKVDAILREVGGNTAGALVVDAEDEAGFGLESFMAAGFVPFCVASSEEEEALEEEEPNRRAKRTEARLSFSWRLSMAPS